MCGNDACGEGAALAGCKFYAGYPITPQNELTAYMSKRMPQAGGVFIQAESELAAINMVFGAAVTGARAMTSSSSPGVSLKQEGISYLAGCELPCVIVNMQRGGPGLGNIAPAQGDYFQSVKGGGHGDYTSIVLAPASAQELLDYTFLAFDLADKYRNPVIVLGDGLLGQMMEPVSIKAESMKPRVAEKPWALKGCGARKPQFIRSLLLFEGQLEEHNKKLQEKYKTIKEAEVLFEAFNLKDSDIALVAYGSVARIAKAAMEMARQKGLKVGLIRPITLWPFPERIIEETTRKVKKFLVVEMSAGQMVEDVMLAVKGKAEVDFYGRMGGGVPSEAEILAKIEALS
jgi:2-oxoglutarate ferredoxin oxidoreductase subunit alpha